MIQKNIDVIYNNDYQAFENSDDSKDISQSYGLKILYCTIHVQEAEIDNLNLMKLFQNFPKGNWKHEAYKQTFKNKYFFNKRILLL